MLRVGTFALFAFLFRKTSASRPYNQNGRQVEVYVETLAGTESDMSNTKCVEYLKGASNDFTKACFDTVHNVNEVVVGCAVRYDDQACNFCKICTTTDDPPIVGYEVDCNNILPTKTTKSQCVILNDMNIQTRLVAGQHFSDQEFIFDSSKSATTDDSEETTSGTMQSATGAAAVAVGALGQLLF